MLKNKQEQQSGDNATNMQAGKDLNVVYNSYGPSYQEVKEIALDIFELNFLKLTSTAQEVASKRAEEITSDFLNEIQKKSPDTINAMKEPDMQYALLMAQKEYARTGDKDLSEVLVDILVERSKIQERSLMQIVLNESLEIVPKLTNGQLNILSLIFILKYSINKNVTSIEGLKLYLEKVIDPFLGDGIVSDSNFQHLEYAGCGNISVMEVSIYNILQKNYGGLFSKGFTREEYAAQFFKKLDLPNVLIVCLQNPQLLQFNAINEIELRQLCNSNLLKEEDINGIISFNNSKIMDDKEKMDFLNDLYPKFGVLKAFWENSYAKSVTLTSVGIALAHANIRRKINEEWNLSNWI